MARIAMLAWSIYATAVTAAAFPEEIEVFYDEAVEMRGVEQVRAQLTKGSQLTVYNFNAPDALEAALGRNLPGNLEAARVKVLKRMERFGRARLESQFKAAYQGVIQAIHYGIDRYPAVVFDNGATVVYGVPDVARALAHYRAFKSAQ